MKQSLHSDLERTIEQRIDRYLAVNHQWVTGNHHFAHASAECLDLYRDGYYLSCIMVTQAVSEGITRFVADRNGVTQQQGEKKQDVVRRMAQSGIVTNAFCTAFEQIQRSFRNDLHHMNPPVATIDLEAVAKRNITDLASIEREIFECSTPDGRLAPKHPQYWDIAPDGSVPVYLRCL
jgi:uncharacterized protein YutE (UPF0331/DUF86 family)